MTAWYMNTPNPRKGLRGQRDSVVYRRTPSNPRSFVSSALGSTFGTGSPWRDSCPTQPSVPDIGESWDAPITVQKIQGPYSYVCVKRAKTTKCRPFLDPVLCGKKTPLVGVPRQRTITSPSILKGRRSGRRRSTRRVLFGLTGDDQGIGKGSRAISPVVCNTDRNTTRDSTPVDHTPRMGVYGYPV